MSSLLTPILLAIHIMLAVALIGVVLLQRSEGGLGGLGGGGGMSGFMTTRGTANLLTRTTRWLAGCFMVTSLVLAWLAAHDSAPRPMIISEPPPVEGPVVPTQDQSAPAVTPPSVIPPVESESGAGAAPGEPSVPTSQ